MRKILLLAFVLAFGSLANANAAIITWNTAGGQTISTDFSTTDFNDATLNFASGFFANQLFDVTGSGLSSGYFHNHSGSNQTITLDLLVDGNWTTIWSTLVLVSDGSSKAIDTNVATPINFTGGIVTALRLTSNPNSETTFHNVNAGLQFDLRSVAAPVPEPATLTIFGVGALGLAFAGYRRRKA